MVMVDLPASYQSPTGLFPFYRKQHHDKRACLQILVHLQQSVCGGDIFLELELELLSIHLMDPSCLASLASTFLDTLMNLVFSAPTRTGPGIEKALREGLMNE